MSKPARLIRMIMTALVLLTLLTAAMPAESNDQLLDLVPVNSLFCLRINNFKDTLRLLDKFREGKINQPYCYEMLTRELLIHIIGNRPLDGIDMTGDFAVIGLTVSEDPNNPADGENAFVATLVPLTDYARFYHASRNIKRPDTKRISKLTVAIPSPEPAGPEQPQQKIEPMGFVKEIGKYILITRTDDYNAMASAVKILSDQKAKKLADVLNDEQKKKRSRKTLLGIL